MPLLYLPDFLYADGCAYEGAGLLVDSAGEVIGVCESGAVEGAEVVRLAGKALLPGLSNAHSHTFQRLFRARAEGRKAGGDTFWTWREQMYRAAGFVEPEDVYDVARATFLEMLASGITAVGEFHYLHKDRKGRTYSDPNQMALEVVRAAESVGIRICLLRSAYMRAGFGRPQHPGQARFYEDGGSYLKNLQMLQDAMDGRPLVTVGAAPHSIRAVPLDVMEQIAEYAKQMKIPLHMHISEQPAENDACVAEYGFTPVTLMASRGILDARTVLVHAIHLADAELEQVAAARSTICSCPTTERNLGDGIFPADKAARLGIPIAFGTDSQAQIDILEDARQHEYHLRLVQRERGILDDIGGKPIGNRLLNAATANGYTALGLKGGSLAAGEPADFFTVDLDDLALMGVDCGSLAAQAVFALGRAAVRDVSVGGKLVIVDGQHAESAEIRARYCRVQQRFSNEEKR